MNRLPGHVIVEPEEGLAEKQLFLVHGILGSSKNWRSYARRVTQANPDWRVVLVDLPAHGMSRNLPGPWDLPACAAALEDLVLHVGPPRCLVGHSFGGKVVVEASRGRGGDPLGVVVLDCPLLAMETTTRRNSEIARVSDILDRIPQPLARRSEAAAAFEEAGFARSLAGWMATNLVANPEGEGYVWHFRREAIRDLLEDYWARDYHEHLEAPADPREFLLVKAAKSDRFGPLELERSAALAAAGRIRWREVPDAGHWLHIDNPDGLLRVLSDFLADLA